MKRFIEENAKYVRDSLVKVTYNSAYGWVSAKDEEHETVFFLQGNEADEYIEDARKLYAENNVYMDDVIHHLAKKYLI